MSGMLRLHGFSSSNYYNVAKLTLLEKQIPFEEVLVYTGAGPRYRPDYLEMSPQGKVPCLQTEQGFLTESRCIIDYLESTHPSLPLYPEDPFRRAKVGELTQIIDLYFELAARRVLRNFFTRKPPPQSIADDVRSTLARTAETLGRLARFDEFLAGDAFTAADVSAVMHFPVVRLISRGVLDFDPLAALPGVDAYLARLEARPTVQRIRKDQAEDFPRFLAHIASLYAG
jgi:glutathione S-transferase